MADQIRDDPELAKRTIDWLMIIAGLLLLAVTAAGLWRCGMLPRVAGPSRGHPAGRHSRETIA